jgi:glycine/D-amino acid oxidase-like deaminating enzyme/nitrite reductase/ring-hydroxylating ferredoxin subunit
MQTISPGSYWHALSPDRGGGYPPLDGDRRVDVAIIGGGITGLTTALHLKEAGRRVVVLEAGRVGDGTTGGTSGHLDYHPEEGFETLLKRTREDPARTMVRARREAIDQIEQWCRKFQIDCDFVRVPAYLYTESADGLRAMERQFEAARRLGAACEMSREIPLPFRCAGGVRLDGCARFHAMQYLRGLAGHVHGDTVSIHENTRVLHPPQDGEPCTVETKSGKVQADVVVAATHSAFHGICSIDLRVAPYQSYVLEVEVDESTGDALFWDDAEPYHYTRWSGSGGPNSLIIGGADHKTGQGGDERRPGHDLEQYVRERYRLREIRHRWSSELFEPDDGVPYVGRLPSAGHVYVASGFSGVGLTWGTAAGRLLADQLLGRRNPLTDILKPSRIKPLAEGAEFIKENLNAARRFVMDRFGGESINSLDEVAPGTGKLVKYNGRLLAVYREQGGELHVRRPQCTHAGCIVQWNEAEHTWDCPCHGGRFSACGERIYGPPPKDLDLDRG